ncbi:hypothetical protein C8R46DRAFT_1088413 [Mycena filopes]|nr:hypothetical protein C8R46DRAFT_1088413 [Mycena filopes]
MDGIRIGDTYNAPALCSRPRSASIMSSPESWTSPLPTPPTTPPQQSPAKLPSTPLRSAGSPSTTPLPPSPPSPPQPTQNLPLPGTLEIHELLTPAHALQLDLSFPSDAFRRNPQLTPTLLAAAASTPPHSSLCVRIAAGAYKVELQIGHAEAPGGAVTVGDVLTTVQNALRQYDYNAPAETAAYIRRRIVTVNGYAPHRDAAARAAIEAAERDGGARVVDRLLGHTLFAGLTVRSNKPDHHWELALAVPERYAF